MNLAATSAQAFRIRLFSSLLETKFLRIIDPTIVRETTFHFAYVDPKLLHPVKNCAPFHPQAQRGAIWTTDAAVRLTKHIYNPLLLFEITDNCRSVDC